MTSTADQQNQSIFQRNPEVRIGDQILIIVDAGEPAGRPGSTRL